MFINEISSKQIDNLNDIQLTELLHRLIRLEAEKYQMSYEFFVPDKITRADGGEDGGIKSKNTNNSMWITNTNIVFQNKAKNLTPGKCGKEIIKGKIRKKLKPQIERVLDAGGKYILFMKYHPGSKQDLDDRIDAFYLATVKLKKKYSKEQFDVYDGRRIADWVNEHIEAILKVQEWNGMSRMEGLMTIDKLGNYEKFSSQKYHTNQIIEEKILAIREDLKNDKACIRLLGHSGLGKTRLVYESLKQMEEAYKSVIYFNIVAEKDSLVKFVRANSHNIDAILIVDNCDHRLHELLREEVTHKDSRFKLITIDYDVSEIKQKHMSSGQEYIFIDNSMFRDVVVKIIEDTYQTRLLPNDIKEIAEYSDGYPQMAVYFAEARLEGFENITEALRSEFQARLLFGRDFDKIQTLKEYYDLIRACSLFTSFGFPFSDIKDLFGVEEYDRLKAQSRFILSKICLSKVDENIFNDCCKYFNDRGILERRGKNYAVKPNPLAIKLAIEWWQALFDKDYVKTVFEELVRVGLSVQFLERFKYLDQLKDAKIIVQDLVGDEGPFCSAEVLNSEMGSQLFCSLVEVNPMATGETLIALFGKMSKTELLSVGPGRRNIIWALEKLCFREDTFEFAAKVLYAFSVSENETWANNATGQFVQLFQIFLPGTVVNYQRRLKIIEYGLGKHDEDYARIAVLALGRGLETHGFTRGGGAEKQGSGKPLQDYRPSSNDEIRYYHQLIYSHFLSIAKNFPKLIEDIKEQISRNVRGLVGLIELNTIINIVKELDSYDNTTWYDIINNLRMTLRYEKLVETEIQTINELIEYLLPKDIEGRIQTIVTKPDWEHERQSDGTFKDLADERAEKFAEELVRESIDLIQYLPKIVVGEQRKAFIFGKKLSEFMVNKEDFLQEIINAIKTVPKEEQNTELLIGYLQNFNEERRREIVNEVIHSPEIGYNSIYLARWYLTAKEDILNLLTLVDKGILTIDQMKVMALGNFHKNISADDLIEICKKIYTFNEEGKWISLEILAHYCYRDEFRFEQIKSVIKEFAINFNYLTSKVKVGVMDDYNYEQLINSILNKYDEPELAKAVSHQISQYVSERKHIFSDIYITQISRTLVKKYFQIFWTEISSSIIGNGLTYFNVKHILGARQGNFRTVDKTGALFSGDTKLIIEWCKGKTPKGPLRIAYMMPISLTQENGKIEMHPFAKIMIDEFGNVNGFLDEVAANIGSFGWMGSTADYYAEIKIIISQLLNHKFQDVRDWANKMINNLDKTIQKVRIEDAERFT